MIIDIDVGTRNQKYAVFLKNNHLKLELILYLCTCKIPLLARALGQARATIVYLVYKYFIIIKQIQELVFGAVYKGRPANGEGVVLNFRTFPDGGRGGGL